MPLLSIYLDDDEYRRFQQIAREKSSRNLGKATEDELHRELERMAEGVVQDAIIRSR
jgi:predicted transcriptional regulator